jgi:hypothetical protein
MGIWGDNTSLSGGIGGSGVINVFNEDASISVVLSPLDNFMAASHISPQPGILEMGIMGNVTSIPKGFSQRTIMYITTSNGINGAVSGWGKTLRNIYDKPDASVARAKDITLQYIGYTTDNGAYYYYNTEPGLDYTQTLVDVKAYADREEIPYAYVLLDSWWYYKGSNGNTIIHHSTIILIPY